MAAKTEGKIKLDVTANEIRYRILEPETVKVVGRKWISQGVSIVVACPVKKMTGKRCTVGTKAQALRFDREMFTPAEAAKWIEKHWRK